MELGPTVSLWKNIFDKELANLQTGKRKAGEVFATVESLAAAYHVSDITARRVLSELAKAGAVRNIPRKGSVVAEKCSPLPVFLLSPEPLSGEEAALIVAKNLKGVFEEAAKAALEIQPVSMDFLLHYSGSAKAFAIYHYSCCRLNPEILLSMLPESILPIGLNCPGIPIRGIGFGSDSNAMVETAMNYLYSHNCRRIVYLGLTAKPWFYSRFETYRRMQADHGVEISSDLLLTRFPDLSKRGRNDLLTHLETARIDGIFAPEAKWMRQL